MLRRAQALSENRCWTELCSLWLIGLSGFNLKASSLIVNQLTRPNKTNAMNQSAEIHTLICCCVRSLPTSGLTRHTGRGARREEIQRGTLWSRHPHDAAGRERRKMMQVHLRQVAAILRRRFVKSSEWLIDCRVTSFLRMREPSNREVPRNASPGYVSWGWWLCIALTSPRTPAFPVWTLIGAV